ncbi:MAG: hypothetical protein K8S13_25260 [Desulfobacula sp.]|uniref:hypothetical protein n=1 Tax=Desulfobacula sp. TaxID=2593537 RepID=UPI0025C2517A|nr:hypothetical protein [Desulfobacula sp.]MCD4723139.1 hypothetical protein [Desulfobacula sp.]
MGVRVEEAGKSECCSVMDQLRVQNLPEHENVQTSSMVLNHVKRFERKNRTGVDDSNSNVTDGRTDLKKSTPDTTAYREGSLLTTGCRKMPYQCLSRMR